MVIFPNIRPLQISPWGWKVSRNKYTCTLEGYFLVSTQCLKIGPYLNGKVSSMSSGGGSLCCRLLRYPGTVFRWQVRGSLGLFLKLSGFLTVARENVDKRGAQQKAGHLKHWFSESLNNYLLVLLPQNILDLPTWLHLLCCHVCPGSHYFPPPLSGLPVFAPVVHSPPEAFKQWNHTLH